MRIGKRCIICEKLPISGIAAAAEEVEAEFALHALAEIGKPPPLQAGTYKYELVKNPIGVFGSP